MKWFLIVLLALLAGNSFAQDRAGSLTFKHATVGAEVKESTTVTAVADVSGSLGGKYFVIYSALDAVKYAVWYNTGSSTAPTVSDATLVPVSIIADDTAATVATNTKSALDLVTGTPFVTTRDTAELTITNSAYGATTDTAAGTSGFTVVKAADGVSASTAIASGDVIGDLRGFHICNDAANTSTYMTIGWSTTIETTGTKLKPGACFTCDQCKTQILKNLKVSAQAASNGYGIVQFKK
jgi:hypothetical protein